MPHVVIENAGDLGVVSGSLELSVKRVMADIARQLHAAIDGSRLGKTNLQQFLA